MGKTYLDTNILRARAAAGVAPHELRYEFDHDELLISPTTVFEILMIPDELTRERTVRLAQTACSPRILVEVERLIVDYIATKLGHHSLAELQIHDEFDGSVLENVWNDLVGDDRKTFIFDEKQISSFRIVKDMHRAMHAFLQRGYRVSDIDATAITWPESLSDRLEILLGIGRSKKFPKKRIIDVGSGVQWVALFLLVVGITPFYSRIDQMWSRLGVDDTKDRIQRVFSGDLQFVLEEGPIVGIGAAVAAQAGRKYDSGNLLDAYHVAYLPFVDRMVTHDARFANLRSYYPDSPNFARLMYVGANTPEQPPN